MLANRFVSVMIGQHSDTANLWPDQASGSICCHPIIPDYFFNVDPLFLTRNHFTATPRSSINGSVHLVVHPKPNGLRLAWFIVSIGVLWFLEIGYVVI